MGRDREKSMNRNSNSGCPKRNMSACSSRVGADSLVECAGYFFSYNEKRTATGFIEALEE